MFIGTLYLSGEQHDHQRQGHRRKLSLLELAQEMSNVSRACRIMGYSRQQFYEIRRNYQTYGAEGLIDRLPGARGPHPNRVSEEVEHRTTQVRRPQSNGFVERLHRTLLDEHFRVLGRTKFYESIQEMQSDLDACLVTYNTKRPHQGRGMNGRTPADIFARCLPKTKKPKEDQIEKAA